MSCAVLATSASVVLPGNAGAQSTYPVPDCTAAAKTAAGTARSATRDRLASSSNVTRLQRALSVKVPITVGCPGKMSIRVTYKVGGVNVRYASGSKTKKAAGTTFVRLRSTRSGRAALRLARSRDRALSAVIRVTFNPTPAGSTRSSSLAIKIE